MKQDLLNNKGKKEQIGNLSIFLNRKKGASTFQGWSEAVIILILFIFAIAIIVSSMNNKYGKSNDASFGTGLQDTANSSYASMVGYQNTMQIGIQNGTATFGSIFGLTLSTSYDILLASVRIFWALISGGWITAAVSLMHLPIVLGLMFQLLYVLSIGYILIKLLFRINP